MKNLLYIGASGGVGQKLIPLLSKKYNIIGHYNKNKPEYPIESYRADVTNFSKVNDMIERIMSNHDTIDILINSAGISINGFAHKSDVNIWKKTIDVNLIGSYNTIRATLPHMRHNRFGRIINFSSIVGCRPVFGTSAYSSSKSGLEGLTKSVSIENISKGVTCNNIALGYFDAGMLYSIENEILQRIIQNIPLKRPGTIDELHNAITFIIDTEYFTGQTLQITGGI